ncbi:hypothetical protein SH501x_005179 [Pirellulaceae bacterium SH501]
MNLQGHEHKTERSDRRSPLMLWCSSHQTLAAEEIPLFSEANFRIVPLLTNLWTTQFDQSLDLTICDTWKNRVNLPDEIVRRLQSLRVYSANIGDEISQEEISLLNEFVDVIYVTIHPIAAVRLAKVFRGLVVFRPFGHGSITTYSNILSSSGIDLDKFSPPPNLGWMPILSSLQEPEHPHLCSNAILLNAFVSRQRLPAITWSVDASRDYIVETIPRIEQQQYYRNIYKEFTNNYGHLPLKILGGNSIAGGDLNDPRILGYQEEQDYFSIACSARLSIYHGTSRYHLHYHPLEFMTMGVPVLFSRESAIANEAINFGFSNNDLEEAGMYDHPEHAIELANLGLSNPTKAKEWSDRQRPILEKAFSKSNALFQARWLRIRAIQSRETFKQSKNNIGLEPQTDHPEINRGRKGLPFRRKFLRELSRLLNKKRSQKG